MIFERSDYMGNIWFQLQMSIRLSLLRPSPVQLRDLFKEGLIQAPYLIQETPPTGSVSYHRKYHLIYCLSEFRNLRCSSPNIRSFSRYLSFCSAYLNFSNFNFFLISVSVTSQPSIGYGSFQKYLSTFSWCQAFLLLCLNVC